MKKQALMDSRSSGKKYLWRFQRCRIAALAVMLLFGFQNVVAAEKNTASEPEALAGKTVQTRKTPAMSQRVYKQLVRIRQQADDGEISRAQESLSALLGDEKLTGYERAMGFDLQAYLAYQQDDYPAAIAAYQQLVSQPDIPLSLELNGRFSLAKLWLMQEKYAEAAKALEAWFAMTEIPSAEAYRLKAQIAYQQDNHAEAESAIDKAFQLRGNAGAIPENWLLLARAIYYARQNYSRLAEVYEQLLLRFTKPEYWVQAAAVYGELGDEKKQLALLETGHEKQALKRESEFVLLSQLLLAQNNPYKAAKILNQAMEAGQVKASPENYRRLADAWYLARHYSQAIAAMEKALPADKEGELYYRLAQMQFDAEQFSDAAVSAQEAVNRSEGKARYSRQLLLGMAFFQGGQLEQAKAVFAEASAEYDPEQIEGANIAGQWLLFTEKEIKRQAWMKAQAIR